ncbi:hypothetical protein C5167_014995 [Papaver somniferum]|uniref:Uncharacterized protein n=1 Tax=Papaver somniferum TaxID=3469 RepID=A0A4Y7J956_PAPSO|nr:hypothetical protein C5167_014995 [Papaver somniferum]
MEGDCLKIEIRDGISKVRFAPKSNNLLISSWDSNLRLFDLDTSKLRSEIPLEVGLLGCCFQDESTAFSIGSDCCLRSHDLNSGIHETVGNHDDLATCVEYSMETCQAITGVHIGVEVESISLRGCHLAVGTGTSVNIYDLRNLNEPLETQFSMEYSVSCVGLFADSKGYAVGSVDGLVAVQCLDLSDANDMSYMFRCQPKSRDGKRHLVSVNDVVFNPSHYGAFVTGDNEGYAIMWSAQNRKRLFQFTKYPNSVSSLSYNSSGQFLAVASSYTHQEANEREEPPQIFIHEMNEKVMDMGSVACGTSSLK